MKLGYGQVVIATLLVLAFLLNPAQLSTGAELYKLEGRADLALLGPGGAPRSLARNILLSRAENNFLLPRQTAATESPLPELPELVYSGRAADKVAITFDDGPYPGKTEQYLEILTQYGIKGTFFVIGEQGKRNPKLLQMIVEQGSELGSHSWAHGRLDKMGPEVVLSDLKQVTELIYEVTGQRIKFVRPPYGLCSPEVIAAAGELNQQLVLWNVDPRDWEKPTAEEIVARVMEQVRPGSIIILHEGQQNTLEALPLLIEQLQERGLQPVSVSELLDY